MYQVGVQVDTLMFGFGVQVGAVDSTMVGGGISIGCLAKPR